MIQRKQTIYLVLVLTCSVLAIFLAYSTFNLNTKTIEFNSFGFTPNEKNIATIPLIWLLAPTIAFALISIFLYKNRKLQLRVNFLNYLLIIGTIVIVFIDFYSFEDSFKLNSYGVGMFLPIAALVFNFLANRGIKSDEKLIDSLNRLR